jgi:tRNA pseudouridine38-40 synthase
MRTLKLTLAYDGTNYVGWQRQENGVSIQQQLEEAFSPIVGRDGRGPTVVGAGRTDAGVHALGQVASVTADIALDPAAVGRALNVRLPLDIRVLAVEEARPGFHAQFHATGKSYRYRIATSAVVSPFDRWFVWHAPEPRDVAAMRAAAALLIGRHDFASFQARGASVADTVRRLDRLEISEAAAGEVTVDVAGDGFLRHMVRIIVGTLADVGSGLRDSASMRAILAARDRRAAGPTAPATGLTLMDVRYDRRAPPTADSC